MNMREKTIIMKLYYRDVSESPVFDPEFILLDEMIRMIKVQGKDLEMMLHAMAHAASEGREYE